MTDTLLNETVFLPYFQVDYSTLPSAMISRRHLVNLAGLKIRGSPGIYTATTLHPTLLFKQN